MKKIIAIAILSFACLCSNAQSEWEKPVDDVQQKSAKRGLFDRNKKKVIDAKYLEGGVPEVDGKVVWKRSFDVPGKSADAVYDTLLDHFQKFVKANGQTEKSQVAVVNKAKKQIGVRICEWLVFEDRLLSLDETKFNYTLIAECADNSCTITIRSLSYKYEEDRKTAMDVTAEEWITDANALNKKRNGFNRGGYGKFRMKTIDRIEAIFGGIEDALK